MAIDVLSHVKYQVMNAPVRQWPYKHFIVNDLLPPEFLPGLFQHMPAADEYDTKEFGVKSGDEQHRTVIRLQGNADNLPESDWWAENMTWFTGGGLARVLVSKFQAEMDATGYRPENLRYNTLLLRDKPGYALGPHQDHPAKIITCVIYMPHLPAQTQEEITTGGTSVYIPKDDTVYPDNGSHFPFDGFDKIATAPYKTNSALVFFKTADSFHGVEKVAFERETLQFQVLLV